MLRHPDHHQRIPAGVGVWAAVVVSPAPTVHNAGDLGGTRLQPARATLIVAKDLPLRLDAWFDRRLNRRLPGR